MMTRIALLLVAALAVPACADDDPKPKITATTTQKPFAQRLPGVAGLENFARVNPNLYRGAQPTEEGYKQLKSMGVKTCISFRSHHNTKKECEGAGVTSCEMPLKADLESVPPSEDEIKKFSLANAPAYQHPRHVWFVDDLPLASTNKVDRSALHREAEKRLASDTT